MIHQISAWDKSISLTINGLNSYATDIFFYWVSDRFVWIPVYAFLIFLMFKKGGKRGGFAALIFVALMILCVDQSCTWFFKRTVERLRPCHDGTISHLVHIVNGHCGGRYGFLSAHSANFFALAAFTSLLFKRRYYTVTAFCLALLTGYSRIYLGVHFFGDVVCGMIWGTFLGTIIYYFFNKFCYKTLKYQPYDGGF